MNTGYLIYQAERTMSIAEQREVDATNARLAASAARLWHALTGLRRSRRQAQGRPADQPVSCGQPVSCLAGSAADR